MRKTKKKWQNVLRALQSRPKERRGGTTAPNNGLSRTDPAGMSRIYEDFLEHLTVLNYSERTVDSRRHTLEQFFRWCQERDLYRPEEVTRPILENYQRWLYRFRQPNGKPLSSVTQRERLVSIKGFFKWLCRQNRILHNPASELEMPRAEKRLPLPAMTARETESVLSLPDISDPMGIRDRAIMETLYSTGIRRSELCRLQLEDIMRERGLLVVHLGKGKKDRIVPIGERALEWIESYLVNARPLLETGAVGRVLFLSAYGEAITPDHLSELISKYIEAANIGRKGSCHLFRHTCATLMLENGADIRYIQQLLGHANLETTGIYTEVTVTQLQKVHALTHPSARPQKLPEQA